MFRQENLNPKISLYTLQIIFRHTDAVINYHFLSHLQSFASFARAAFS